MGYNMLKNVPDERFYKENGLAKNALLFIRNSCENLRYNIDKSVHLDDDNLDCDGTSIKPNQIPYNMQMDIDRLCLENAVRRFLESGKKEDAFDVYFCYLEMFVGDYEMTRRMIELLSEFEANGSGLLMKHRDHYSHSVYVFVVGLAIYESNSFYRNEYNKYYGMSDCHEAACHYLKYWGLASLFHDIGYPFELPFEQVASYFEVNGDKRSDRPFVTYKKLDDYVNIDDRIKYILNNTYNKVFNTTDELFAYVLAEKLGNTYEFTEEEMYRYLNSKPTHPEDFNYFMDHAYFSATVLFKKLFEEMKCELTQEYIDAMTAIIMHNSLYKFCIAHYKDIHNKPLKIEKHPLAYMLMLCDELQCWDRIAYGRNSKTELHPMGCSFDFSEDTIKAVYLYDIEEIGKINKFIASYEKWVKKKEGKAPSLKAYSGMYICNEKGVSSFQEDIERIVDLTDIKLNVKIDLRENIHVDNKSYLSSSNFINLYNFAVVLNERWNNDGWKSAKAEGKEDEYLANEEVKKKATEDFKILSLEYKLSNINQAKAFSKYMNEIGCFYTDKQVDFDMMKSFTEDELIKIGILEHQRWVQEHFDMGWEYGEPDKSVRDLVRQHKDMIPNHVRNDYVISLEEAKANYERLEKAEQDKDTDPMECMLAMLKMYDGLRMYRLN